MASFSQQEKISENKPMASSTSSAQRRTRVYKLYSTGTGNATASLILGASGVITSISWTVVGAAAAAVTGAEVCELSLNANTSNITTNDTPGNVLDNFAYSNNIASSGYSASKNTLGLSIPVTANDRLYINQATANGGTNLSSRQVECCIYVS